MYIDEVVDLSFNSNFHTLAPFTLANLARYIFSMGLSRAWSHP